MAIAGTRTTSRAGGRGSRSFSQVIADLVGLVLLVVTAEKRLQFLHAGRLVCPAPVDSIWPQGELFSAYVTGQDTPRVVLRSVNLGLAQLDGETGLRLSK